ncbi:MAG: T9SS type A sorting domain-containing protein [Ignavibacteria bacterium]|nr:T9SS type A sorting domain-containing protein [Ignavibacteria bacterium]
MRSTTDRSARLHMMKEIMLFNSQHGARNNDEEMKSKQPLDSSSNKVVTSPLHRVSYEVPFASSNNTIELSVENNLKEPVKQIIIRPEKLPSWLHFMPAEINIQHLAGQHEKTVIFRFTVDRVAPIKKEQLITLLVSSSSGDSWTKEMVITVTPPDQFELFQNYPNPFNPSTTLSYQLSADGHVKLAIYNLLGQQVALSVDEEEHAGYHEITWDARNVSSGVYYMRLTVTDHSGRQFYNQSKKLMLAK